MTELSPGHPSNNRIDRVTYVHVEGGRLLVCRNVSKDVWFLPGGKPDPDESRHDTLVREIWEELGVTVVRETIRAYCEVETAAYRRPLGTTVFLDCYTGEHEGAPAVVSDEIAAVDFFSAADRQYLGPADRLVLDRLVRDGMMQQGLAA